MHTRIRHWHARRSGPTITILGDIEGGKINDKVSGISRIYPADGKVMATTRDGQKFELVVDAS